MPLSGVMIAPGFLRRSIFRLHYREFQSASVRCYFFCNVIGPYFLLALIGGAAAGPPLITLHLILRATVDGLTHPYFLVRKKLLGVSTSKHTAKYKFVSIIYLYITGIAFMLGITLVFIQILRCVARDFMLNLHSVALSWKRFGILVFLKCLSFEPFYAVSENAYYAHSKCVIFW